MAYSGNGTQEDPYIVDNWEDLKAVCVTRGVYVHLNPDTEHKVMDINETDDAYGLTEDLMLYGNIEGNGWEIRNLCTGSYDIKTNATYMTNLHFRNLISGSMRIFWGSVFCTNCTFTILCLRRPVFSIPNGASRLTGCSLHLYFSDTSLGQLFYGNTILSCCDIVLDGSVKGLTMTDSGKMENCRITGDLQLHDGDLTLGSYNNTTAFNIVAVKLSGSGQVLSKYASDSLCLVDTDLIDEGITVSLLENWQPVTTAQLQDAEYLLQTLHFPCAAV